MAETETMMTVAKMMNTVMTMRTMTTVTKTMEIETMNTNCKK